MRHNILISRALRGSNVAVSARNRIILSSRPNISSFESQSRSLSDTSKSKTKNTKSGDKTFKSLKKELDKEIAGNEKIQSGVKKMQDVFQKTSEKSTNIAGDMRSKFAFVEEKARESFEKVKVDEKMGSAKEKISEVGSSFEDVSKKFQETGQSFKEKFSETQEEMNKKSKDFIPDDKKQKLNEFKEKASKISEKVSSVFSSSFSSDETTWADAIRSVFGMKETDRLKKEEELRLQRIAELKEAERRKAEGIPDPEPEVNPYEAKILELADQIKALEELRNKAEADSDIKTFKTLNKEIKKIRSEIQEQTKLMNTNALTTIKEDKGKWEEITDKMRAHPILQDIFGYTEKIQQTKPIKAAKDIAEDARNVWETSQNPIIFNAYNAYEKVFKESEEAEALKEFRKIDPKFSLDMITEEIRDEIAPKVLSAYLRGDMKAVELYCEEQARNVISADIQRRIELKQRMDTNILDIGEIHVLSKKVVDKVGPIVAVQFMAQQIDAKYNLEGDIVEGSDEKVAAVFYLMVLTRKYIESEVRHRFVVREFGVIGQQQYL